MEKTLNSEFFCSFFIQKFIYIINIQVQAKHNTQ
jgi:hypothetical protein